MNRTYEKYGTQNAFNTRKYCVKLTWRDRLSVLFTGRLSMWTKRTDTEPGVLYVAIGQFIHENANGIRILPNTIA